MQRIEISGKSIWQVVGVVLATIALVWAVMQAQSLVSMVLISFFFSLALDPAVRWLMGRYGWRRGSATGVISVAGVLFAAFMVAVIIPALAGLATVIGERGAEWIGNGSDWSQDNLGREIAGIDTSNDLAQNTDVAIKDFAAGTFGTAVNIATAGIGLIFSLATIAMFTVDFTANAPQVQNAALRLSVRPLRSGSGGHGTRRPPRRAGISTPD